LEERDAQRRDQDRRRVFEEARSATKMVEARQNIRPCWDRCRAGCCFRLDVRACMVWNRAGLHGRRAFHVPHKDEEIHRGMGRFPGRPRGQTAAVRDALLSARCGEFYTGIRGDDAREERVGEVRSCGKQESG